MAWQFAFLVIGSDPARFRPLMVVSIFEKFSYVVTLMTLYGQGRLSTADFSPFLPDMILGLFFIAAFVKSGTRVVRDERGVVPQFNMSRS